MKARIALTAAVGLICAGCEDSSRELEQRHEQQAAKIADLHGQLVAAGAKQRKEMDEAQSKIRSEQRLSREAQQRVAVMRSAIRQIQGHLDARTPEYERAIADYKELMKTDFVEGDPAADAFYRSMGEMKEGIDSRFADFMKIKAIIAETTTESPRRGR